MEPTTHLVATRCSPMRAVTRCSRVLNYDLARWVTELRPQLQSKEHTLLLDVGDPPLPPVLCDRKQLRQVLVSLITVAHTMTDKAGSIIVSAHAVGGFVTIEVKSTGAGHTVRTRGFEPFARTIVEAHGGSTAVRHDAAGGTTLGFTVPIFRESASGPRYSAA